MLPPLSPLKSSFQWYHVAVPAVVLVVLCVWVILRRVRHQASSRNRALKQAADDALEAEQMELQQNQMSQNTRRSHKDDENDGHPSQSKDRPPSNRRFECVRLARTTGSQATTRYGSHRMPPPAPLPPPSSLAKRERPSTKMVATCCNVGSGGSRPEITQIEDGDKVFMPLVLPATSASLGMQSSEPRDLIPLSVSSDWTIAGDRMSRSSEASVSLSPRLSEERGRLYANKTEKRSNQRSKRLAADKCVLETVVYL